MLNRAMNQAEAAARAQFFARASALVEGYGGTLLRAYPGPGDRHDTPIGPSADYELGSRAGRLSVTVFDDWVATRFDRPGIAARFVGCNPHSGKWNFHRADKFLTASSLDDFFRNLDAAFRHIGAHAFERKTVAITSDEIDEAMAEDRMNALLDRQAFGEMFVIDGFDQAAAADEMARTVTAVDGERPDWLRESTLRSVLAMPALQAYAALADLRGRTRDAIPDLDPSP